MKVIKVLGSIKLDLDGLELEMTIDEARKLLWTLQQTLQCHHEFTVPSYIMWGGSSPFIDTTQGPTCESTTIGVMPCSQDDGK